MLIIYWWKMELYYVYLNDTKTETLRSSFFCQMLKEKKNLSIILFRLTQHSGTSILKLLWARTFKSSTNIFEGILFWCSTTCSALYHCAKICLRCHVYPWCFVVKQRRKRHFFHRFQAAKFCLGALFAIFCFFLMYPYILMWSLWHPG